MRRLLKGNRTRLFGTAIAILGVIETYAREIIPADWQGWSLTAIGIAVILLRQVTSTPPGEKY